jgi:16S rRNA (adenine(1408)-N(1))-methyltransferase
VIDIGAGDGLWVYQSARMDPDRFYIGIEPNPRTLEKISEKIHRRPERGGAPNVLYAQASVEDLPPELDGAANEIHVQFPWGSLLRAVAAGDVMTLSGLRRICAPGASLEVVMSFHPERDRSELERLGLSPVSISDIDTLLAPRYQAAGFDVTERAVMAAPAWTRFQTTWGKRLRSDSSRVVVFLRCQALA